MKLTQEEQKQRKRERMKVYLREYYRRNKEKASAVGKARYQAHRDKIRNQVAEWRRLNPDKVRSIRKRQAAKSNARRKAWARKNKAHLKSYLKDYKEKHRAEILHYNQVRRALKAKATVNLAGLKAFMKSVRSKPTATCYYCSERFSSKSIHFEHIIPLDKGGPHSVENLCVSCPGCNLSKADKMIGVWVPIGQQILAL